ncbi:MAG: hypothetical protein JW892_10400 [Anaerolineae bacterium]|nr:hypothetical protein [Anaerolineae bacterium]
MSYEWHVDYALQPNDKQDLQDLVDGKGEFETITDLYTRLRLLAQSVSDSNWNTDAKSWSKRETRPNVRGKVEIPCSYQKLTLRYHDHPQQTSYTQYIQTQMEAYATVGFVTPRLDKADITILPEHSCFLYIPFTLAEPYLSKDDVPFYVHENPVCKECVLRTPIVKSTSWKGAFRAALRHELATEDKDARLVALLGNAKGEEKAFRRGRLTFFPTFFNALEVEVINPHARETGAGKQPIHIEGVPQGAQGCFALLYTPLSPDSAQEPLPDWSQVLSDLDLVGRVAYTLLAETGFGAKAAAGMGRAAAEIPGAYLLAHHWLIVNPQLPAPPSSISPSKQFQPESAEFLDVTGVWPYYTTDQELEVHILGNKAKSRYKRERMAYREWLSAREQWDAWEKRCEQLRAEAQHDLLRLDLSQLDELNHLRAQVEEKI